jgi:hypothetical protein
MWALDGVDLGSNLDSATAVRFETKLLKFLGFASYVQWE